MKKTIKLMMIVLMLLVNTQVFAQYNVNSTSPTNSETPTPSNPNITSPIDTSAADNVISSNIQSKFSQDAALTGANINVVTHNGLVTLTGTATSQAQIDEAVKVAKKESGVFKVNALITLQSGTEVPVAPGY